MPEKFKESSYHELFAKILESKAVSEDVRNETLSALKTIFEGQLQVERHLTTSDIDKLPLCCWSRYAQ